MLTVTRLAEWLDAQVAHSPVSERYRERGFFVVLIISTTISGLSIVLALGSALWALAALNVVLTTASAYSLRAWRASRSPRVVRRFLWWALLTLGLGALTTTPMELTTLGYLLLIPLVASMSLSGEEAQVWFLRGMVVGAATVVAGHAGVVVPEVDPLPAVTRVMNFCTTLGAAMALLVELSKERDRTIERLREAERVRSTLFANVGHELRTPMNGVLGMTDALLLRPLAAEEREMAEAVRSSGKLLLSLLDDLLDLSKLEAGALALHPSPTSLPVMLGELKTLWAPLAQRNQLAFALDLPPSLPAVVLDGLRVRQVLGNLVSNAIKFTPRGGVTVRVSLPTPSQLQFSVTDTGIGITPEQRARLFERFAQADDARARRYQGAGLGLALSRQLALRMGGQLEAESQFGVGTTFHLTLPLVVANEEVPAAPAPAPERLRPLHVLVVDDNAVNQLVARRLLDRSGCTVEVASDAETALDLVARQRFDVVLMDVHMPRMDGLEATRRLRAREQGSRLPIIGVSASAASEDIESCMKAGMDDFLAKPVTAERLLTMVRRVTATAPAAGAPG